MPLEDDDIVPDATETTDTFPEKPTANRLMTKKELFEELYAKYQSLPQFFVWTSWKKMLYVLSGWKIRSCFYTMTSCAGMKAYSSAP